MTSQQFVSVLKAVLNGFGRQAESFRSTRIYGVTFRNVHEVNWDEVFSDKLSSSCMSLCFHTYIYIYIYICVCVCVYMYMYMYIS